MKCARCGTALVDGECPRCTAVLDAPDLLERDALLARVPRSSEGIVLGGVRLARALGAGAMGAVYAGLQLALDREVAVKVLQDPDPEAAARFRREGQIAARLDHPRLVRVFQAGHEHGLSFLVLELVRGESAASVIAKSKLGETTALSIALDAARGLAQAHRSGILHRDVKPANVLVERSSGRAKLADLGLARPVAVAGEITTAGQVVGTPLYMAPELWRGGDSSSQGDVWALGATLHELVTGRPPFAGAGLMGLMQKITKEEPEHLGGVSPRVAAVIRRCLEKDPARRYPTATELEKALEAALASKETAPPAPIAPHSNLNTNLVPRAKSFVGRASELETLERAFDEGARLVTLWGAGGSGKTRLASEHAQRRAAREPGGAWFCDLTEARTLEAVAAGVASTLGVPLPGGDAIAVLGRSIAARGRTLVVLDNLEQVIGPAGAAVARWVAHAPEARFLATSRELLGIDAERPVEVLPLPVESAAGESDAERLFLERARAARGSPVPVSERGAVRELVKKLDGMPLAIELAAARARVLSPRQLLELMPKLDKLARPTGSASARHATLRAAIDASFSLLSPVERKAFAQASVFHGGFSLEAAEAVIELPENDAPWVGDVLDALSAKSLVRAFDVEGERRFGLYETIREYGLEKLGADAERARERHARHFLAWGRTLAAGVDVHGGAARLARLALERDNLIAVAERAIEERRADEALGAVLALGPVFDAKGPLARHTDLLERSLAIADGADDLARARATLAKARASILIGKFPEARDAFERALASAVKHADASLECSALEGLALISLPLMQGMDVAERFVERGLAKARASGDKGAEARLEHTIGLIANNSGRPATAHLERALELFREVGNSRSEAAALGMLGRDSLARGDPESARAFFEQSLALAREVGARWNEGRTLAYLALSLLGLARDREAAELAERARVISKEIGDVEGESSSNNVFAELDALAGDFAKARARLEPVAQLLGRIGHKPAEAGTLFRLATVALAANEPEKALDLAMRSLEIARLVGDKAREASLLGTRATALSLLDRALEARAAIDEALALAPSLEPYQRAEIAYHEGVVALAEARLAARAGDPTRALALRARARAPLGVAPLGLHARWAARLLERALG